MSPVQLGAALALALVAAVLDARRGTIPDWATLPPLVLTPLVVGWQGGAMAAGACLVGAASCVIAPLMLHRRGAMGGGDVKLFAALGALLGWTAGGEVQLLAYVLAALLGLAQAARAGQARVLLAGGVDALRRSFRRGVGGRADPRRMHAMRLAPVVAVSAALVLLLELPFPDP